MPVLTLYDICLTGLLKISDFSSFHFNQLPNSCLRDILPYLTPYELERFDSIYYQRYISINHLWRRHFELIWSLSRDDKDMYESLWNIPYKRLYFEYLFHDTQILQLGIYTHISQINQSKSILSLSFHEQTKYSLTRDSIIYCSKRRLAEENPNLVILWNHQWDKYIKRFILVPNVWNLATIDPLLINCFTENVTDIVLSGYPTENDTRGMKFILDILTRGHVTNIAIKFPSYCLMNILLPLLIFPRSYSLSYSSTIKEMDPNIFVQNFILPRRKRKLCLQVEIQSSEEKKIFDRVLSTHEQSIEEDENNSIDTTHAVVSHSINSLHESIDLLASPPNTSVHVHSSILGIRHDSLELNLQQQQQHILSDSLLQSNMSTIESSHLLRLSDHNRFNVPKRSVRRRKCSLKIKNHNKQQTNRDITEMTVSGFLRTFTVSDLDQYHHAQTRGIMKSPAEPHERLLPYLNRSRTLQQYPILPSILTPARHLSTSEQFLPTTNITTEPFSSSDSNLFRRHTTITSPIPETRFSVRKKEHELPEEKFLILHLTPQNQTNSLTNLSIYYISSIETIEMIAIALLGMKQIHHLTLVSFASYSSQLETSLVTLCTRSQLRTLHLTSIALAQGAIGFLLYLYQNQIDQKNVNISLQRLRLDAIKSSAPPSNHIHLSDIEQAEFLPHSSLEQLIWRERHMQYIHIRLLYKLLPNMISKLVRLELSSILECAVLDQFQWCQTFLHHITDVRLRNFRVRPMNLARFFLTLNTSCLLTVFHFERIGLMWNNDQPSSGMIHQAFTSLILESKHLRELSLAYNNLNDHFIQWLCQILSREDVNNENKTTSSSSSWWSIITLNLTFNLIPSESIRRLHDALKEYRDRWRIRSAPIRRIDILGNAIEMREIPNLKKQMNALGCDLISYILTLYFLFIEDIIR